MLTGNVVAGQKVILFDEGHGQHFLAGGTGSLDLSKFAALINDEKTVVTTSREKITGQLLADVTALVISGAFIPFTEPEITAISDFVKKGGRLCVMLHIAPPLLHLLKAFNVYASKGVVMDEENQLQQNPGDFHGSASNRHKIVEGVQRIKVYGGWALLTQDESAKVIVTTGGNAWLDTNMNRKKDSQEEKRTLNLAVTGRLGHGEYSVFGDDAIFQNRFLTEENLQLGRNLAGWLKGDE